MMWIGIAVCWTLGGGFVVALCAAAARGDEVQALPLGRSEPRQVGVCGSCGEPVMLNPDAAEATCPPPCGQCVLPRRFLRYGERAHG